MTAPTLAPGCNMPSIPYSPEKPDLWWYSVEATETGLISALADEEGRRSDDYFAHLVFFPTWSERGREVGIYRLKPGQKVRIEAAADNTLRVVTDLGTATFPGQVLVIAHDSLDAAAVEAYYAQEG